MKKILFTRKLIKTSEEYASNIFKAKFNVNDKLLSKEEIITQSNDCDGIISTVTEDLDNEIISKLSKNIKIISQHFKIIDIFKHEFTGFLDKNRTYILAEKL